MKGAGFFSLFPKDLQRHMFKNVFDETTRVMLVCATKSDNVTIISYLKLKLAVRKPINWFEWAMCHGYDDLVSWAESLGITHVDYKSLCAAIPWGSVTQYLPRFISLYKKDLTELILIQGHILNFKWHQKWIAHCIEYGQWTRQDYYNSIIIASVRSKNDEAKSNAFIRTCVEWALRDGIRLKRLCLDNVVALSTSTIDLLIEHNLLDIVGKELPLALILQRNKIKIALLLKHGAIWMRDAFSFVNNSLEFLRWAFENGYPRPPDALRHLISSGNMEAVEWWMEEYHEDITIEMCSDALDYKPDTFVPWVAKTRSNDFCIQVIRHLIQGERWDELEHFAHRKLFDGVEHLLPFMNIHKTQKQIVEALHAVMDALKIHRPFKSYLLGLVRGVKRQKN